MHYLRYGFKQKVLGEKQSIKKEINCNMFWKTQRDGNNKSLRWSSLTCAIWETWANTEDISLNKAVLAFSANY